jgi:hypothetical protein
LSYDFNLKRKSGRSLFGNISLYANVANEGIIWRKNKEGIDPDYPYGLAPSKQYTIGLKLQ